ncbi:4a-hydroxytetrahydrobiopterin dehydratase [bacterium]|jgi:4a-hydroxytetrahydrobiopterin dehydratase|nr:4a-hydroxytetrahydrobiopterin dehydratase [bacterium]
MHRKLLNDQEIEQRLGEFKGWVYDPEAKCLKKGFVFKNFVCAFAVMAQVAIWAEKLDHHPDWKNVYNRLEIRLNTHDLGGVSTLDFELLKRVEESVSFQCNLEAYAI